VGEVPHVIPFKPPLWPLRASIPLAAALALLQGLANWIRALKLAFTGRELT
jgi:TRAP-type mannitol/chloroaromatic compound transport system permease small subunit